jgi:DNA-binding LytR/AlgR family response regulator
MLTLIDVLCLLCLCRRCLLLTIFALGAGQQFKPNRPNSSHKRATLPIRYQAAPESHVQFAAQILKSFRLEICKRSHRMHFDTAHIPTDLLPHRPVISQMSNPADENRRLNFPGLASSGAGYLQKIALPIGRRVEIVSVHEIDYLRSHANYVSLHVGSREFVLRATLASVQAQLDPARFLRVHRCCLVQLEAIARLEAIDSGRYRLNLRSGAQVLAGRAAKHTLRIRLGIS